MGGNSILAYFFRPALTRGETLTWGGFSGGKFYTEGIVYATTAAQICTSVLNDRKFACNFMWKMFIKIN